MVRLFCPVGQRHGVRPKDLVGAITGQAQVPGHAIGRIEILTHHSLIDVSAQVLDRVLHAMRQVHIRGQRAPMKIDRDGPPLRPGPPAVTHGPGKPSAGPPKGKRWPQHRG